MIARQPLNAESFICDVICFIPKNRFPETCFWRCFHCYCLVLEMWSKALYMLSLYSLQFHILLKRNSHSIKWPFWHGQFNTFRTAPVLGTVTMCIQFRMFHDSIMASYTQKKGLLVSSFPGPMAISSLPSPSLDLHILDISFINVIIQPLYPLWRFLQDVAHIFCLFIFWKLHCS